MNETENAVDTVDLGIAFLADGEAKTEAARLRSGLAARVPIDPVYSPENIFHITLFQNRFPTSQLAAIRRAVASCAGSAAGLNISFQDELYLAGRSRHVFWNCRADERLSSLHMEIVERLNPLRSGLMMPQFEERLNDPEFPERDKGLIRAYGVYFVGASYLPHITLAKLTDEGSFAALGDLLPAPGISFAAASLVVGRIGSAGDLLEVLHTVELAG